MTNIEQLLTHCPSVKLVRAHTLYNTTSDQLIVDINTVYCRARVALQGAQPLQFHNGNEDILWLSPHANFNGETAIRGGIPLCLPWFGINQQDSTQAKHGFARNQTWQLTRATETDSEITLAFSFEHHANDIYPYSFSCDIVWRFNTRLYASFSICNLSAQAIPFSYALHSYFQTNNKYATTVKGLDGCSYLDNTLQLKRDTQTGDIHFDQEVDRVYENSPANLQINTPSNTVSISAENMPTAIIWNPGTSALKNHDIKTTYTNFICVEYGAAFNNEIKLGANQSHKATMLIT